MCSTECQSSYQDMSKKKKKKTKRLADRAATQSTQALHVSFLYISLSYVVVLAVYL